MFDRLLSRAARLRGGKYLSRRELGYLRGLVKMFGHYVEHSLPYTQHTERSRAFVRELLRVL
jgi:hypothetical protein